MFSRRIAYLQSAVKAVVFLQASCLFGQLALPTGTFDGPLPNPQGGKVSVWELLHPVSRKGKQLLDHGLKFTKSGEYEKAIEAFKQALKEPTVAPYAHANLGVALLRIGDLPAALPELEEGAHSLAAFAAPHSNLAYALCLSGQAQRAEEEANKALAIDTSSPQARFILGMIKWDRGLLEEARSQLEYVQRVFRTARLVLAVYYTRLGEPETAKKQLQAYLSGNRKADSAATERWVARAAAMERPAAAFGFRLGR